MPRWGCRYERAWISWAQVECEDVRPRFRPRNPANVGGVCGESSGTGSYERVCGQVAAETPTLVAVRHHLLMWPYGDLSICGRTATRRADVHHTRGCVHSSGT